MKLKTVFDFVEIPDNPKGGAAYHMPPSGRGQGLYKKRTDRNIGWISAEEQTVLKKSTVGVGGCGGMGGYCAEQMARLGVGTVKICDNGVFDETNINRQFAAKYSTVGKNKAVETARLIRGIVDDVEIELFPGGINSGSAGMFVKNCDIIIDEIDFTTIKARISLHQAARAHGIPVIMANAVGFAVNLFLFTPQSMTVEEFFEYMGGSLLAFEAGANPARYDDATSGPAWEKLIEKHAPALRPYYEGNYGVCFARLAKEGVVSAISTNLPMATGFVSNRVLLYLLKDSGLKRDISEIPEMPGYLSFDAATMEARVWRGRWWQNAGRE